MDLLERARALAATAVLGDVAAPTLIALAERAAVLELEAGTTVTTRRPDGVVVIVVARGVLEVGDARAGAGELLGAASALDAEAPAVSARAAEASVVLELGQDDFIDVLAEHPVAARALARDLAVALREARRAEPKPA
jgi:CRP-like cAMP-binding protein